MSVHGGASLPRVLEEIEDAAAAGFAGVWLGELTLWDPLTVFAALGERAPGVELGTAVMAVPPRHPLALAAQVLTTQAATGGRLSLGLGMSHRFVVEEGYGLPFDRPVRRVREFLDVLDPVLDGREAQVRGETVVGVGGVGAPGASRPPVLLAAHGPRMLALAGERADGVITLWTRPGFLAEYVVPAVTAAGRAPRILVGVNACVTADPDAARRDVAERLAVASGLPSYRETLDRQGATGIEDTILAGDEAVVAAEVRRFAEAGATDLVLFPSGPEADRARTLEVFGDLARAGG
ncbi:TIGR03564 family F420-dependent LLM class oxidoreductase [Pseudonocardia ailaonensis]|uniref:TIGR03564 family F420-dependent LLM class oxidoreductase n=1 Tax=Pseudonocardia ailaonensis TaxID=367279 RepID=A0ABN2N5L2_9PSEU